VREHPLNNYDINFQADGLDFEFYKTNHLLYSSPRQVQLLQGARFRVFRTDINPTLANLPTNSLGLITFDPITSAPNAPWEEVEMLDDIHISPGSFGVPLGFEMDPGFTYQLVEYFAPAGFQIPFGQWRVRYDTSAPNNVAFQYIGEVPPPMFIPNTTVLQPGVPEQVWFVGNMPVLELPLTGGTGTVLYVVAGFTAISAAVLAAIFIVWKKGNDKQVEA